jgi:hypothetical protein
METHIYAILSPEGRILATTDVEGWCERHADAFGGVPARWAGGAFRPVG